MAENFSLLDPSSNDPMVHGGLDAAGGLISFQKASATYSSFPIIINPF